MYSMACTKHMAVECIILEYKSSSIINTLASYQVIIHAEDKAMCLAALGDSFSRDTLD